MTVKVDEDCDSIGHWIWQHGEKSVCRGQGGNKRPIGKKMGGGEVETVSIVNS